MYGKISTGMVTMAVPPSSAINTDIVTKVYGRRSASLTIHILCFRLCVLPSLTVG